MVYHKNFENVQRRTTAVPTDRSAAALNFFNASMIIRIPAQPIRSALSFALNAVISL